MDESDEPARCRICSSEALSHINTETTRSPCRAAAPSREMPLDWVDRASTMVLHRRESPRTEAVVGRGLLSSERVGVEIVRVFEEAATDEDVRMGFHRVDHPPPANRIEVVEAKQKDVREMQTKIVNPGF